MGETKQSFLITALVVGVLLVYLLSLSSSPGIPIKHMQSVQDVLGTKGKIEVAAAEGHSQCYNACPAARRFTARGVSFTKFVDRVVAAFELAKSPDASFYWALDNYATLVAKHCVPRDGFFAEFGVHTGTSLVAAYKSLAVLGNDFKGPIAGFDSFEGLPEHWTGGYGKGAFAVNFDEVRQKILNATDHAARLYKGWFEETTMGFLGELDLYQPAAFLHMDGDLFKSAMIPMSILNDRIVPGTLLDFDELFCYQGWRNHEILALYLWMSANDAEVCALATVVNHYQLNLTFADAHTCVSGADPRRNAQSALIQVLRLRGKSF